MTKKEVYADQTNWYRDTTKEKKYQGNFCTEKRFLAAIKGQLQIIGVLAQLFFFFLINAQCLNILQGCIWPTAEKSV